jgi:hypothetical protein
MKFRIDRLYLYMVAIGFSIEVVMLKLMTGIPAFGEWFSGTPLYQVYSFPGMAMIMAIEHLPSTMEDTFFLLAFLGFLFFLPLFWITVAYSLYRWYMRSVSLCNVS